MNYNSSKIIHLTLTLGFCDVVDEQFEEFVDAMSMSIVPTSRGRSIVRV